ncbi:signal peptidase I [Aneurinibacillus migulanus]|uniref:signal peptidase I n=1 Tax=Aneurinibacillus migulanus TaxID=47500 RepID=UPI0009B9DC93|nr:signal peptidase I [Aneurinibacillus migulanus]MED0891976.1 signal peptidase I [Aneurinibacillus migulanus]MED1617284.1 signal peptidase I [Aneurinibacillus migulanus]
MSTNLEAKQDETLRVTEDYSPYTIPQGTVFVLGDNRWNSYDSRVFGSIKLEQIIGKVVK